MYEPTVMIILNKHEIMYATIIHDDYCIYLFFIRAQQQNNFLVLEEAIERKELNAFNI